MEAVKHLFDGLSPREGRAPDLCEVLQVPLQLRPDPHLSQAGGLRHPAPSQEGFLCSRVQRRARRTAMGLSKAKVPPPPER